MQMDTLRFIEPWMQDALWQRTPGALSSRERDMLHLLMGTYEFDRDGNRKNNYCKVRFTKRVVIDIWESIQRRRDLEDKDLFSLGLASEFQVLMYPPWFVNPADDVMISTLIFFEDLQNINVWLRLGKMNGYSEAPGQTTL